MFLWENPPFQSHGFHSYATNYRRVDMATGTSKSDQKGYDRRPPLLRSESAVIWPCGPPGKVREAVWPRWTTPPCMKMTTRDAAPKTLGPGEGFHGVFQSQKWLDHGCCCILWCIGFQMDWIILYKSLKLEINVAYFVPSATFYAWPSTPLPYRMKDQVYSWHDMSSTECLKKREDSNIL